MLFAKQKLSHRPVVLESTFLIHPNGDFESAPNISVSQLFHFRAHTHPVSIKNHPTPPIHPTRMCRGKNPMRAPRRSLPRMKKLTPVRRAEKENATSVVAMTTWGLSSPTISVISLVRMWKNGYQGDNRESLLCENGRGSKTTYHYLDHHAAVSTCETTTTECVHKLRDDCPNVTRSGHQDRIRPKVKGREYARDEEKGHAHGTEANENCPCREQDHAI